jgi:hypothetical protein
MRTSSHLRLGNDALSHQAKAGVTPVEKPERRKKGPKGLARSRMERKPSTLKVSPVSSATDDQKAKVLGHMCIAFENDHGPCWGPVDPAHLIDRSLAPSAGEDVRAVVPLCRRHHNAYDDHDLDLSPLLEPHWREEVAWAVEAVGLFTALKRITGKRWTPLEETA